MTDISEETLYAGFAQALAASVGASNLLGEWEVSVTIEVLSDDGLISRYDVDGEFQCSFRGVTPASEIVTSLRLTAPIAEQAEFDMLALGFRLIIEAESAGSSADTTIREKAHVDIRAAETTIIS